MTPTTTTPNQAIHLIVEEEDGSNTTMVDRPSRLRKRRVRFQQEQDEKEAEQAAEKSETETHEQQEKDSMIVDDTNDNDNDDTVTRNVLVLTDEMCRELWYQQDEIDEMKVDVKQCVLQKIASQRRRHSRTNSNSNSNSTLFEEEACSQEKEDKDRLLGLHRFSPQRSQWKRSAIYYTLLAQKQQKHLQRYSSSPSSQSKSKPSCSSSSLPSSSSEPYKQRQVEHFIRKVSLRCTAWAREMAVKQGFKDYCAVHDPLASLFDDHVDHKSANKEGASKRRQSTNYNDCFFSDHAVEDDDDDDDGDVSNIDDVEDEIVGYDDHHENDPNTDKNNSINCCHLRVVGNNKRKHSSTVATTTNCEGFSSTPVSVMMEESKNGGRNVRRRVSTKVEGHDHNHDVGRLPPVPEFREDHLIE
mmetsp:Transcript_5513/g.13266  ORF Transcript_5513/g.13266 Transcript_5513/m.13266 type:complete len:414 (-) Transcript_5513:184-1425(-)